MNEKLILRYIKEVDFGLWTRWKLWTTEVLILSLALATDSEQQFNNNYKEWSDQASRHNYKYEVSDQEIDVGRKSTAINAQGFPYVNQTRKTNKENIATVARKSWQSSNEKDDAPNQISNNTIHHQL
jgi:hypothetical protein